MDAYPQDFELHYLAGMIACSQHLYSDAVDSFEKALHLNPEHAASLFELGLIHMIFCRFRQASPFFRKVKSLKYHSRETNRYLENIQKAAQPKDATLSVCMIVKNEEKFLEKCLKSVQAVADEIIVVDTVRIAEKYGARVFHYEWQNDFAAARNFTTQKACGDWILQIDADEELFAEDQLKVRELIHQNRCDGAFVALHCKNSTVFGENQPTVHYLVRLFKNREDFHYVNPVHEVLQYSGKVIPVDINILHHGYNLDVDYLKMKRRRNAEILYQRLQKDPENLVNHFYLSMLHLANKEFNLCEQFAKKALAKSNPDNASQQHIHLMALNNLATVHLEKEDYAAVRKYCQRAIAINENYLDPQYFLGLAYFRENNYLKAKEIFHDYLSKYERLSKSPVFNLFITSASAYVFQIYHLLGKIYRRQNEPQLALKMFSKAVDMHPDFWLGYADLGYVFTDLKKWHMASVHLEKAIELAKANPQVNRKNAQLWFDFSNLLKIYALVLKKRLQQRRRKRSSACDV
ncbi:MAG: glycosyltransferase [bacterium]